MNRFFTLLLAASCLTAVGQVPDYVPADGLVAWWNMFENGLDSSPNQIHPINEGFQAGLDRFGNDAGCFDSGGTHIDYGTHPEFYNESFTFSAWINPTSAPTQRTFMGYHRDQTGGATLGLIPSNQIKFHTNVIGYGSTGEQGVVSSSPLQANVWTSVVGTYSMGLLSLYLNGVLDTQLEGVSPPTYSDNNFFQVGKWTGGTQFFGGLIDDVGVWNRALSDAEVLDLYLASAPEEGCTDHEACNYEADAIFDDGTCYDCDIPASHCGVGTVWDAETQTCIVDESACGWQPDGNGDNLIGVNDLLDLLGVYGDTDYDQDGIWDSADDCVGEYDECGVCNGSGPSIPIIESIEILYDSLYAEQIDEWWVFEVGADTTYQYVCGLGCTDPLAENYNELADTDDGSCSYQWACGEPLEYQGYDYETVQIGEQCWFAENLMTSSFDNGVEIPNVSTGWMYLSTPAFASIQNDEANDDELGYLYNWNAVLSAYNLCPAGWSVPSKQEFEDLHDHLGGHNVAGGKIKSVGFESWSPPNTGATNESGLSALAAGWLNGGSDEFFDIGLRAAWWTSSQASSELAYGYWLFYDSTDAVFPGVDPRDGYSVRCIKNVE